MLLADQDRRRWDRSAIRRGLAALKSFDLPVIMGTVLIGAVVVVVMNLVVDIAYSFIDPRVRLS